MAAATAQDENLRPAHPLQPIADLLGRWVARTGIHPDLLTLFSLLVAILGAWTLALGWFLVAPFVFLVAMSLDFLDGAVARATGKVSQVGGYMDSLTDRYVDFLLLFAIMLAIDTTPMWTLGTLALFGVLMTSGAKWRIHEDHHPDAQEWGRDLFERTERTLVLLPGILLHGIWVHLGYRGEPLFWVVGIVAVLANLTVLQRIMKARRLLRRNERKHHPPRTHPPPP